MTWCIVSSSSTATTPPDLTTRAILFTTSTGSGKLNKLRAAEYPNDPALDARIKSYELAFRMQKSLPEVLDFSKETEETKKLYGLDKNDTRAFGQQLLASRRLVEHQVPICLSSASARSRGGSSGVSWARM